MSKINLLSDDTINKIAAGEVVERPMSVVKELIENSIDAGAKTITVEIKDGGISFIRVTDDGQGISKDDIRTAFLRHATSKIKDANDLLTVSSLGFRGEALSSIASVAKCELITKTSDSVLGYRYVIEGEKEVSFDEIGAPDGTTFIIRDLFFNTPARKKFLKSVQTEASNIINAVNKIAMSHPDISFKLIAGSQTKLLTNGNGKKKDVIYAIYGKDVTRQLTEVNYQDNDIKIQGFIGKPSLSRGNRSYELFEVNGRSINSLLLNRAVEEAYRTFVMQHKYPFVVLSLTVDSSDVDVNVHPAKLEIRFRDEDLIYDRVNHAVYDALTKSELINNDVLSEKNEYKFEAPTKKVKPAEPFESNRIIEESSYVETYLEDIINEQTDEDEKDASRILSQSKSTDFKIIGTLFDTYLLVNYKNDFLIIDQHAAHEKVMYENFMKQYKEKKHTSQVINPPIILTLTAKEQTVLFDNIDKFNDIGFEIEAFGGNEVAVYGVPGNLYEIAKEDLLIEILDDLAEETGHGGTTIITDKIAMMSCKAAVKGNMHLSMAEAEKLINDLLSLENPYTCPHGRPTAILMSKEDIEKKFKRIL